MKKIIAYVVLVISVTIYIISASEKMTRYIAKQRFFSNSIFSSDKYRFGDLYCRAVLPWFKDMQFNQPLYVKPELYRLSGKKIIDLYAVHDSYLMRDTIQGKFDTLVQGIHKYVDIKWWKNLEGGVSSIAYVNLDSTKENFLLIEITERDLRYAFSTSEIIYSRLKLKTDEDKISSGDANITPWYYKPYALPNPGLEDNLQFNLFDYHFFTPIMELKAVLNYELFGRTIDKAVTVSSGGTNLYYSATVNDETGSFCPVSDKEINRIVQTLNEIYKHYKSIGFDEVFFSPIPNPAVVLNTENKKYNELIPRIQNSPELRMPVINAFKVLKNAKYAVFTKGESHWTRNGYQLWLNEFNKTISNVSKR